MHLPYATRHHMFAQAFRTGRVRHNCFIFFAPYKAVCKLSVTYVQILGKISVDKLLVLLGNHKLGTYTYKFLFTLKCIKYLIK